MTIHNQKGHTLVEVIVSIAIITIIIGVFSNILFTALKARNISRDRLQALAFSTSFIEEVKSTQNIWKSSNGLKEWLENNNFEEIEPRIFNKNEIDSTNINYSVTVSIDNATGIDNIFQLKVTTESSNANEVSVITRLRGE